MKNIFLVSITFLICNLYAKSQDIDLIEEKGENKVLLYAQNNTEEELEMTLNTALIGYTTNDKLPVNKILDAKAKVLVLTLLAPKGIICEYQTSISYKKVKKTNTTSGALKQRMTSIQMNSKKVNVFTQDGCARCEYVIKYLDDMKIPYVELNTTIHDPNQSLMFEKLNEVGFKGTTVQMPVVVYSGKTEYNIKDLTSWVKGLK